MNNKRGYVTLMSAVIVSATLIMIMLDQSLGSFSARFSVLDHEKKTASFYLAMSCVEKVKLFLTEDEDYTGNETLQMSDGECDVGGIGRHDGDIFFQTSAVVGGSNGAHTDLNVKIDPQTGLLFISENLIQ